MSEHGAMIRRVINGGGIPQNSPVLNQVYGNVLGRPVLVPSSRVTGIGSAIFAFLAAGTFRSIEECQDQICPAYTEFTPQPEEREIYNELYTLFRRLYFDFGKPRRDSCFGDVLPKLIQIARARKWPPTAGGYECRQREADMNWHTGTTCSGAK
jgi:L-ribulokinase